MALQGYGELIRAILRLETSIAKQRDAKQQVEVNIELSDKLAATASPGAKVSILGKYAGTGAFSGREHEVARNLSAYRSSKRAYESLRVSRDRLQQRIDTLSRRRDAMSPNSRAPGGINFVKAAEIKDRIRVTQKAKQEALLAMRGHRRRATGAVGAAESAALGSGSGSSIALSAARLSTAVTALTAAYKVGQAVIGAAEANLHRYGGYSAGGMQAQLYDKLGDFTRTIYVSHKTSDSMIEFAKANTKLKDSFADLNVIMINFINKLGSNIADTVAGTVDTATGKRPRALSLEERKAAVEKAEAGLTAKQEEMFKKMRDVERDKEEAEKSVGSRRINEERIKNRRLQNAASKQDVADAEKETEIAIKELEMIQKRRVDIAKEKEVLDKRILDIIKKEEDVKKKDAKSEMDKFREQQFGAFGRQIRDMPQFGRKAVDLDDPRAARMAADYLARVRRGSLPAVARGLWARGGRNVNIRRMPGGGVRGGPFRRRRVPRGIAAGAMGLGAGAAMGGAAAAAMGMGGPAGGPRNPRIPNAVNQAFAGMSNDQLIKRRRDIAQKNMDAAKRRRDAAKIEDEASKKAGRNAPDDPAREAASKARRAIDTEISSYAKMIEDINKELKNRTAADRPQNTTWMFPTPSKRDPAISSWI